MERETEILKEHLEEEHLLVETSPGATASGEFTYYAMEKSLEELEEIHRWHHEQESSGHSH
jgi:hypothetical protein